MENINTNNISNTNTEPIKLNSPIYVLISIVLLILLAIFTRQGTKSFDSFKAMFGDLSKEILLVVVVLLLVIMIINIYDLDMDIKKGKNYNTSNIVETKVVEGLSGVSNIPVLNSTDNDGSKSFCEKYQSDPILMNEKCKKFNKSSCIIPSCCVWLNDEKCVSGSISGPTFKSDENNKDIVVKNFYYQGECYGEGCPSENN